MSNIEKQSGAALKQTGKEKTARNPIKIVPLQERLRKPEWIRVKSGSGQGYHDVKRMLREHKLHTVCEEASCPNIGECFGKGTATFMILGDVCTRRCPFCDVAHGKPLAPDINEPDNLARSIGLLKLKYVVITSVDRDDLRDGGARHFADCLGAIRASSPATRLEILVPDFRGRLEEALDALSANLPDVLNHNLETVPRLYKLVRPGADYAHSLKLLKDFKARFPDIPTKSGVMLGLGETDEEVLEVMRDLRTHEVNMLTIGQYLQPSDGHLPVLRYAPLESFTMFEQAAKEMGFSNAACGPMVRSSYFADEQAQLAGVIPA
jgi:lipoic acid synthetase